MAANGNSSSDSQVQWTILPGNVPTDITLESLNQRLQNVEEDFRKRQDTCGIKRVAYEDLCAFPEARLPPGFKVPKFEKYDGVGNPYHHLKSYCDKLFGLGYIEEIRVMLFSHSLTGDALSWYLNQKLDTQRSWDKLANAFMSHFSYNTEVTPTWTTMSKFQKGPTESFADYLFRWRKHASKVEPVIYEEDMVESFLSTHDDYTFRKLRLIMPKTFSRLLNLALSLKEGIRSGKLCDPLMLMTPVEWANFGWIQKEGMSEGGTPIQAYHHSSGPLSQIHLARTGANYHQSHKRSQSSSEHGSNPRPTKRRKGCSFTPLTKSRAMMFEELRSSGILHPIKGKTPDPSAMSSDNEKTCAYHSGMPGHDTEHCFALKRKIQQLIDTGEITIPTTASEDSI